MLSIESVITIAGTNSNKEPNLDQFLNLNNKWFELDSLAEDKVFVKITKRISDNSGIKPGKWMSITRKFIHEYTDLGFLN
jgi:hypothetical protein